MVVVAGGERRGIDLDAVREVAPARACTPLPGAPACVLGLANLGGRVVTVVDLAAALGLDPGDAPDGRIVVVSHAGRGVGLAVDEVVGIDPASAPTAAPLETGRLLGPLFA
jgi:purine-binding chemotaxis protein CheW